MECCLGKLEAPLPPVPQTTESNEWRSQPPCKSTDRERYMLEATRQKHPEKPCLQHIPSASLRASRASAAQDREPEEPC